MNLLTILLRRDARADDVSGLSPWRMGISCASSWSWGVSMALGMHFMHVYGYMSAAAWMVGNILALPLLGFMRQYVPASRYWTSISVLYVLFFSMEFMGLFLNLTATRDALSGNLFNTLPSFNYIGLEASTAITFVIGLSIVFLIHRFGFRGSCLSDTVQYAIQLGAVSLLAISAFMLSDSAAVLPRTTEAGKSWWVFAFFGVLVGALTHFQQHQRFESLGNEVNFRVGLWGGFFFGVYMLFVFISGFFFSDHVLLWLLYVVVILSITTSTMDSAVAGMQRIAVKFGFSHGVGSYVSLVTVLLWLLVEHRTLHWLFNTMMAMRLPVAIAMICGAVLYEVFHRRGKINPASVAAFGRRLRLII